MKTNSRPGGLAGHAWDFFVSVKLTVATLILLAFTSIFGTLIPQNQHPADYINAYGEFFFRFFNVFDLFDMYDSWWYRLLIITLTVNILTCSVKRLSPTLAMVFRKKPAFKRLSIREEITCDEPAHGLKTLVKTHLSPTFKTIHIREDDKGFSAFAEKGAWTRLGFYAIHLSIIILLFGALLGSLFGIDGHVNIPEGEAAGTIRLRNSGVPVPLDFKIQCNAFNISYYKTGSVKEFRSSLEILENGKQVSKKDIIVNDPLKYKGYTIYQSSYGRLKAKKQKLDFTNRATGEKAQMDISVGRTIAFPEDDRKLTLKKIADNHTLMGQDVGEAYVCEITENGKHPKEVILPTRFPSYDKMRKGEWVLSVAPQEKRFYTGLSVKKDPGVWLVYTGFILLIAGCFISFFMSHNKMFIQVKEDPAGTSVTVSGASNRNKIGMKNRVKEMAAIFNTKENS
ncbi:MAG: cytochrome c biogenesis protein ResB [Desulfobacteraceae bacterium]|nr:cytochrome c biogenesis protein ResB [Desulfobacteraceae bacterium]